MRAPCSSAPSAVARLSHTVVTTAAILLFCAPPRGAGLGDATQCYKDMLQMCNSTRGDQGDCFLCLGSHQQALHEAGCNKTYFVNFCSGGALPPMPPPTALPCCNDYCAANNCYCEEWGCHDCVGNATSCNTPPLSGGCCTLYSGHNTAAPCLNPYKCDQCRDGHNCRVGQACC
eukprot:COSAG05_NODE_808_length_7189_cov_16.336530_9_plen_174_part_00